MALLARHFLHKFALGMGKTVPDFTEGALFRMERYQWPGNVRELENMVERMVNIVKDGEFVDESCLPAAILRSGETEACFSPGRSGPSSEAGLLAARETESIIGALRSTKGNMRAAAALLGVSRGGLYLKIKRLGINVTEWRK